MSIKIKRSVDKTSYARPPRLVWAGKRDENLDKDGLFWIPGIGLMAAVGDTVIQVNQTDWNNGASRIRNRQDLKGMSGVRRVSVLPHVHY